MKICADRGKDGDGLCHGGIIEHNNGVIEKALDFVMSRRSGIGQLTIRSSLLSLALFSCALSASEATAESLRISLNLVVDYEYETP